MNKGKIIVLGAVIVFCLTIATFLAIGWNFLVANSIDVVVANRYGAIIVCCSMACPISVLLLIKFKPK